MKIDFFETNKFSELIPSDLIGEELSKKIGNKVILNWFFKMPSEREIDNNGFEREQPIIIRSINSFSDKLNAEFFLTVTEKFDYIYDYDLSKTYQLFFRLNPISPPKHNTRLSWWGSNIIYFEFTKSKWSIVANKVWNINEIFNDDILKLGEVKIKNGS